MTRACGEDTALKFLLAEAGQGMRRPSDLESANLLEILAFEKKAEGWFGGFLAFPWCTFQSLGGLSGGDDVVESLGC